VSVPAPPLFELLYARLALSQSFLHLQSCIAKRPESGEIDGSFHHRGVFLQELELVPFLGLLLRLLRDFAQALVQILPELVRFLLHPDPHLRLHAMIGIGDPATGLPQGMKLADLMRDARPEFGSRLQFGGSGVAHHPQHGHIQGDHGSHYLLASLFGTLGDIFGGQDPPG